MFHVGLYCYFSGDLALVLLLSDLLFGHYFHGANKTCFLMFYQVGCTKIATT